MSKFTFICVDDPSPFADTIVTKRTFEFDAAHLDGVIGEFETFLRGCGFRIQGSLVIEEEPFVARDLDEDNLDDLESIFGGKKSVIRSDEC